MNSFLAGSKSEIRFSTTDLVKFLIAVTEKMLSPGGRILLSSGSSKHRQWSACLIYSGKQWQFYKLASTKSLKLSPPMSVVYIPYPWKSWWTCKYSEGSDTVYLQRLGYKRPCSFYLVLLECLLLEWFILVIPSWNPMSCCRKPQRHGEDMYWFSSW